MKKVLFTLLTCLWVVPAMAFYDAGYKLTVNVLDEYRADAATAATQAIELTCGEERDGRQVCDNKEKKVQLVISDDRGFEGDRTSLEREYVRAMRKENVNFNNRDFVLVGRSCNENANRMVIAKYKINTPDVEYSGHFVEGFAKVVQGKGFMAFWRYYDPSEEKYSHFRGNVVELLDTRRNNESDIARFCNEGGAFRFPKEDENTADRADQK